MIQNSIFLVTSDIYPMGYSVVMVQSARVLLLIWKFRFPHIKIPQTTQCVANNEICSNHDIWYTELKLVFLEVYFWSVWKLRLFDQYILNQRLSNYIWCTEQNLVSQVLAWYYVLSIFKLITCCMSQKIAFGLV